MPRYRFIDDYRGFSIISMILVNFLAYYTSTPAWLKHAKGTGYTFADLVAPMFLFVLGIMFRQSLLKRINATGSTKSHLLMIRRFIIIMLIGFSGGILANGNLSWGILQAIGLAGIFALPFIALPWKFRAMVFILLLFCYQYLLLPNFEHLIVSSKQGGPIASLSWASIIIAATIAGDFFHNRDLPTALRQQIIYLSLLLLLAATIASMISLSPSKASVNMPYILISVALASFIFTLFLLSIEKMKLPLPCLGVLGKNALLIFLLHYVIIKVVHKLTEKSTPLFELTLYSVLVFILCYATAWILDYKKWYLKI